MTKNIHNNTHYIKFLMCACYRSGSTNKYLSPHFASVPTKDSILLAMVFCLRFYFSSLIIVNAFIGRPDVLYNALCTTNLRIWRHINFLQHFYQHERRKKSL